MSEMYIYPKGATYCADCDKCGCTLYTHERTCIDHNERRDAMEDGTLRCDECERGHADPETFKKLRDRYAGHYSADGYIWTAYFDTNKHRLERGLRKLRDMYGD